MLADSRGMDAGRFPYGEASWYQTDDGTIFMFHRNETDELRLSQQQPVLHGPFRILCGLAQRPDGERSVSRREQRDSIQMVQFRVIGSPVEKRLERFDGFGVAPALMKFENLGPLRLGTRTRRHAEQHRECVPDAVSRSTADPFPVCSVRHDTM